MTSLNYLKLRKPAFTILLALLLTQQGCTTIQVGNVEPVIADVPPPDKKVESMPTPSSVGKKINIEKGGIRNQAIENANYTHAFQKTVLSEYEKLLSEVYLLEESLNEIFDFNRLVYNGNLLPPVIEESHDYLNKTDRKSLVESKSRWKIVKDARVVITVPTWFDYLSTGITSEPLAIDPVLFARNPEEELSAKKGRLEGALEGRKYAEELFKTNLAQLEHDYKGMLKFKKLIAQGMIDEPVLAISKRPVIHSQDGKELIVGQKNFVITKDSQFKGVEDWQPLAGNEVYQKPLTVYSFEPRQ